MRRRPLAAADRGLAALLLLSFGVHLGCVGYLRSVPRPAPDIEALPDRFPAFAAQLQPPLPPPQPKEPGPGPRKLAAKSTRTSAVRAAPAESGVERRLRISASLRHVGILSLVARGEDGVVPDLLSGGAVTADPDEIFRQVRGGTTVTASSSVPKAGGVARFVPSELGDLRGPDTVETGRRTAERLATVLEARPIEVDGDAPPDVETLSRELRARLGAIRACYENGVRHNATLTGKLTLRFTVGTQGKVTEVEVEHDTLNDAVVVGCIRGRALAWHLPTDGRAFSFSYPFLFVAR